jgi:hypothetical protein
MQLAAAAGLLVLVQLLQIRQALQLVQKQQQQQQQAVLVRPLGSMTAGLWWLGC